MGTLRHRPPLEPRPDNLAHGALPPPTRLTPWGSRPGRVTAYAAESLRIVEERKRGYRRLYAVYDHLGLTRRATNDSVADLNRLRDEHPNRPPTRRGRATQISSARSGRRRPAQATGTPQGWREYQVIAYVPDPFSASTHPRPDFIVSEHPPTEDNRQAHLREDFTAHHRSWLIGDFKIGVKNVYDSMRDDKNQWQAIVYHAAISGGHQILPVATYITLRGGTKTQEQAIMKQAVDDGALVYVLSFL